MTKRDIAILSLKLMAIYAIFLAIKNSGYIISFLGEVLKGNLSFISSCVAIVASVVPFIFYCFCAFLLWKYSDALAVGITRDMDTQDSSCAISKTDVQLIAFSIIGLYVLVSGVPNMIAHLVQLVDLYISQSKTGIMPTRQLSGLWSYFIADMFQIVFGLWLFISPSALVRLWHGFQQGSSVNNNEEK